jgi:hypothetical protein
MLISLIPVALLGFGTHPQNPVANADSDECVCGEPWSMDDHGDINCAKDQMGCTNCDNDGIGPWCLADLTKGKCSSENGGVLSDDSDPHGRKWFYCTMDVADTCKCKDTWDFQGNMVQGCPNPEKMADLDNDEPWCEMEEECLDFNGDRTPARSSGVGYWGYCDHRPACECKDSWDCGDGNMQSGCPILKDNGIAGDRAAVTCNGEKHTWCPVKEDCTHGQKKGSGSTKSPWGSYNTCQIKAPKCVCKAEWDCATKDEMAAGISIMMSGCTPLVDGKACDGDGTTWCKTEGHCIGELGDDSRFSPNTFTWWNYCTENENP